MRFAGNADDMKADLLQPHLTRSSTSFCLRASGTGMFKRRSIARTKHIHRVSFSCLVDVTFGWVKVFEAPIDCGSLKGEAQPFLRMVRSLERVC